MRNRGGRPAYQPSEKDRRIVESMTGFGATQDEIARVLGCSDVTLRKYYNDELKLGVIKANTAVAQSLFELATKDRNVAACIWWLKTRAGWRETPPVPADQPDSMRVVVELVGEPAAPRDVPGPARPALTDDVRRSVQLVG